MNNLDQLTLQDFVSKAKLNSVTLDLVNVGTFAKADIGDTISKQSIIHFEGAL